MYCVECGTKQISDSVRFCAACGHAVTATSAKELPAHEYEVVTRPTPGWCPVCGSDSAVSRVSAVIDSGTGSTVGGGFSAPLFGGPIVGTTFAAASSSNLASRLAGPAAPGSPWLAFGFLGLGIGWFAGFQWLFNAQWWGQDATHSWLFYLLTVSLSSLAGILGAVVGATVGTLRGPDKNALRAWERLQSRLRNAYYCQRDDVVFDSESAALSPEAYIQRALRN